jgi:cysteine desulfurase / selenocysteine lyase
MREGLENMMVYEHEITLYLLEKLLEIDEVQVYAPHTDRVATISFNVRNTTSSDVAHYLDREWGIYVRSGLQCSPMAHRTINTFPKGTVRFSLCYFNTKEEVDTAVHALKSFIQRNL